MDSQTVDFGIDLGTTNSAIARATAKGVRIVKSRLQGDTRPSAVARNTTGQMLTAEDALGKPDLSPATRFKRLMGTTNSTRLSDGSELLPEQLSAEVLKDLKASVHARYDLDLTHVVITVPAMFQQPQCEATHRAAKLAGLNAVSLLQEPIAAATAYLDDDPEEGDYLVYDLGGGTFDVSVVRLRDKHMSVIGHGGDNYLGGSDFDKSLLDWTVNHLERRHGVLHQLTGDTARYRLLRACEEAKKRLSDHEETFIDLGDLNLPVAQVNIARITLESLIEEPVDRTIRMARSRVEEAGLTLKDIRRVLLVGGATMTPYIRRRLKDELGIRLSMDQDPMTVVAIGAAIHASTLLVPVAERDRDVEGRGDRSAKLELHYDPVSPSISTTLAGKVVEPPDFAGDIRVARSRGDWETGWIPLRNAAFLCDVTLDSGAVTEFTITLRDSIGRMYDVAPSSVTLRNGIAVATAVAPYDYGVALADGTFHVIVERNKPLPAYGTADFIAAKVIPAGSPEILPIYFLEGLSPSASDNGKVGELFIRGTEISRTLREGERIEVRIHMDESRRIKARVSIPLFDLDYSVALAQEIPTPPDGSLHESLREVEEIARNIQNVVNDEDEDKFREIRHDLDIIAADIEQIDQIENGKDAEAVRVASKLATVKANLHPLKSNYALLSAFEATKETLDQAENMATTFEDRLDLATVSDLRVEAEKCFRLEQEGGLSAVKARGNAIFWKYYTQTRECWIGWVVYLKENREFASDAIAYDEWVKRAHDCLERDDFEGVRLNGKQAFSYLPIEKVKDTAYRDAGLASR